MGLPSQGARLRRDPGLRSETPLAFDVRTFVTHRRKSSAEIAFDQGNLAGVDFDPGKLSDASLGSR